MKPKTLITTALVLSAPVALADYPGVVLADAPLAYYRFEEAAGATTLADSSGNGLHATGFGAIGSTTLGEPGTIGSAVLFNGDGSVLTPLTLDPSSGDFTIEALVNPTHLNNEAVFISNQNGTGLGRSNFIVQINTGAFRSFIGGRGSHSTGLAEVDTWYHAMLTYDQSAAGGADPTIRFYVNGQLEDTSTAVAESANGGWVIGSHKSQASQFYPGLLDEVAFYDKRLDDPNGDGDTSDSRVTAHYNAYLAANVIKPPVLPLAVTNNGSNLIFEWKSRDGALYTLRSSADLAADLSTWEIVEGDIPGTSPNNTKTLQRPNDLSHFYRVEEIPPPPITIFSENFDDGPDFPDGWKTGTTTPPDTGTTQWELGDPAGGPAAGPQAANSAPNCMGTNLAANYGLNTDIWLRSPGTIDLTTATGATLVFQQFRDIEPGFDDRGSVRVLLASDESQQLGTDLLNPTDGTVTAWVEVTVNLPPEALGEIIKLEFRFESDEVQNFAGWYIDDVVVTVPAP